MITPIIDFKSYLECIKSTDALLESELERLRNEEKAIIKQINTIKDRLNKEYHALQRYREKTRVSKKMVR